MSVPPFQDYFLPFLQYAGDGKEHTLQETAVEMAKALMLSEADVSELLTTGRQTKHVNRTSWTKTFLSKAQVIEATGRARFRISPRGQALLSERLPRIDITTLNRYPEFVAFRETKGPANGTAAAEATSANAETPEEHLDSSYQALRKELGLTLLQQVMKCTPAFFEQLVVDLLVSMGYGGSRADAGKAVGQSGDEGIDGIIKEDRLGLDIVYLQAKRWQNPVGRPQVQSFVGSLVGKGATKGVMLTTSRFTEDAQNFVKHLQQKVVLIDGEELATLMMDFDVGVATAATYAVKKIDLDYFGEE